MIRIRLGLITAMLFILACNNDAFEELDLGADKYHLYDASGKLSGWVEFKDDGRYVFEKYDFYFSSEYPESVGFMQKLIGHYTLRDQVILMNDQVRAEIGLINRWGAPVSSRDRLLFEKSDMIIDQITDDVAFVAGCRKVVIADGNLIEL